MKLEEYRKTVCQRLSRKRYEHSLNVAEEAVRLARKYGADPYKAEVAGVLHDSMKETPAEAQLQWIRDFGIILDKVEQKSEKLLHAISGMVFAQKACGVEDADVLGAIRFHTTARPGMTLLEKVLYVADFVSEDRDYDGVEVMRERAGQGLEIAMFEGLAYTIHDLAARGLPIHENTVGAYNELIVSGVGGGGRPTVI